MSTNDFPAAGEIVEWWSGWPEERTFDGYAIAVNIVTDKGVPALTFKKHDLEPGEKATWRWYVFGGLPERLP